MKVAAILGLVFVISAGSFTAGATVGVEPLEDLWTLFTSQDDDITCNLPKPEPIPRPFPRCIEPESKATRCNDASPHRHFCTQELYPEGCGDVQETPMIDQE